LFAVTVAAVNTLAQNELTPSVRGNPPLVTPNSPATAAKLSPDAQAVVNSLSSLPEADTLIYINPQRILNEVVPKFLPAKDIEGLRQGFEEVRKSVGIDPTKVDYIVIAVRFKKPTADLNFQPPEFMVVSSGDFSADSLLVVANAMVNGSRTAFRNCLMGTRAIIMTAPKTKRWCADFTWRHSRSASSTTPTSCRRSISGSGTARCT